MAEMNRTPGKNVEVGLDQKLEQLDEDLSIMDRHATEMARVENDIQESMRRWDREYKDERLHSVPRPRKHLR